MKRVLTPVRLAFLLAAGVVAAAAVFALLRPGPDHAAVAPPPATLEPGPNPPSPPPAAVVLARQAGALGVALEAEPHRLTAVVLSPAGGGLSGLRVRFLPLGVAARPCGAGCYASPPVDPGRRVRVEISGYGPTQVVAFALPRSAPAATATVTRLRRAYNALPGVTYEERLASSPTDEADARWRLEAPDRLAYAIRPPRSGEGIVIGHRRWDRSSSSARWQPSKQRLTLHQPATLWERATNAHALAVHGSRETVSFYDPTLGAFFAVTFDRRTLRPQVLHMIAVGHFMTDRYVSFDPARQIRPPR